MEGEKKKGASMNSAISEFSESIRRKLSAVEVIFYIFI